VFEPEDEPSFDVLTDVLFNALVGFAFLFFLAFAMMNPTAKTGMIDTNVKVLISVSWPDNHPDDVDMYVQDPDGNIVWYNRREAGLMHLDRDDRGQFKDTLLINGREVANPLNQESVSLRGLMDGEYTVNVVHFLSSAGQPLTVTAKVEKMNPSVTVIYYGDVVLNGTGQERTVVRFTLEGDTVSNINTRQKDLVVLTRGASK